MSDDIDPVAARRAQIARWVKRAQRLGYSFMLLAIVAFAVAAATDFPGWLVGIIIGCLIAAIVILPVPIVLGYGVRAAERDERRERSEREHASGS